MGETKVCEWTRDELCDREINYLGPVRPIESCIACLLAKLIKKAGVKQ